MRRLFLAFGFLLFFAAGVFAQPLEYYRVYQPESGMTAEQIMRIKYHNKFSLFAQDHQSLSQIFYVAPSGFTRRRDAVRQRITKAGEGGFSYKDLVAVTYPTDMRGLAILTWTYQDAAKNQDVWLWLPSLKRVRKISASEDDDAFMGSDLTVEEVSTRRFEDESYTLLGEKEFAGYRFEHTGEMHFAGRPCFVIEARTRKPHWYYSKRIVWIDKETGGNIFEEYYDARERLFKTLFRQWTWIETEAGKRYPVQQAIECKDLRTNHRTVVLLENLEYDRNISEHNFTVRALMRSRW